MFNRNDRIYSKMTGADIRRAFLIGGLAGILVFVACYGVSILNVTNDAWLLSGEDITQHYVGWKFYRVSEWTFPIGQIQGILYPQTSCIIYSDSLPILAIFFKILSPVLPETFQYFGIAGLISFFLVGAFTGLIARRGCESLCFCFLAGGLTCFMPCLLYRMFIHTALAGQWIILAAIAIWVYRPFFTARRRRIFIWTLLLVVGSLNHIYYIPMVLLFFFGFALQDLIAGEDWIGDLITAAVSIGADLLVLYVVGAFSANTAMEDTGLGVYSANLNSLINPLNHSRFLKFLPCADGQLEGFGYLGLGFLILTVIALLLGIYTAIRRAHRTGILEERPVEKGRSLRTDGEKAEGISCRRQRAAAWISLSAVFILGALLALSPVVRLGKTELVTIPYPDFILSLLSIFRTSGRFIWCICYLIAVLVILSIGRIVKKQWAVPLLAGVLVLQAVDIWPLVTFRRTLLEPKTENTMMHSSQWETLAEGKAHLTILPWSTVQGMNGVPAAYEVGNFAVDHGMTINYFPIARIDYEKLAEEDGVLRQKAENREDEDTLYILDAREAGEVLGLVVYEIDGYYVGVRE